MTIGERVCSRIAAISPAGNDCEPVAWTTTWRWPPASAGAASATWSLQPTKSSSGSGGERLAQAVEAVAGARHVDADAVSHY